MAKALDPNTASSVNQLVATIGVEGVAQRLTKTFSSAVKLSRTMSTARRQLRRLDADLSAKFTPPWRKAFEEIVKPSQVQSWAHAQMARLQELQRLRPADELVGRLTLQVSRAGILSAGTNLDGHCRNVWELIRTGRFAITPLWGQVFDALLAEYPVTTTPAEAVSPHTVRVPTLTNRYLVKFDVTGHPTEATQLKGALSSAASVIDRYPDGTKRVFLNAPSMHDAISLAQQLLTEQ